MSDTTSFDNMAAAMATVAVGAAIQGILGFGCALVWMSFFPLFTTIPKAVGILRPLAIGLDMLLLLRLWRHSNLRELQPLAMTAPFGVLLGLWVVISWPLYAVNGLLGSFLLLYVGNACREDYHEYSTKQRQQQQRQKQQQETVTQVNVEGEEVKTDDLVVVAQYDDEKDGMEDDDQHGENLSLVSDIRQQRCVEMIVREELSNKNKDDDEEANNGIEPPPLLPPLHRSSSSSSSPASPVALTAGFVGGCLASAFGTSGPAILVFAHEMGWERHPETFRANLQVIFFALNVLTITSMSISGIINLETLRVSIALAPALTLGAVVGGSLASSSRMVRRKDVFRLLVLGGIGVMGMSFLFKALREHHNLIGRI